MEAIEVMEVMEDNSIIEWISICCPTIIILLLFSLIAPQVE